MPLYQYICKRCDKVTSTDRPEKWKDNGPSCGCGAGGPMVLNPDKVCSDRGCDGVLVWNEFARAWLCIECELRKRSGPFYWKDDE